MNVGLVSNTFSSITNGQGALSSAKSNADNQKFADLLQGLQKKNEVKSTLSSSQISQEGRLNGEYITGFNDMFSGEMNKNAKPSGAAANQANDHVKQKTIDKTSTLYEKSMELESYFVKQMLNSMRKTVMKSSENDFAKETYEDMLYDEYSVSMTKNGGFGLADQIYLSLVQ